MNSLRRLIGATLLAAVAAGLTACALPPDAPTVLASAGGTGPDDAYVVYSLDQEHEILSLLGFESHTKVVRRIDGRTFDVFTVAEPETEEARDIWFDISRFFDRS